MNFSLIGHIIILETVCQSFLTLGGGGGGKLWHTYFKGIGAVPKQKNGVWN